MSAARIDIDQAVVFDRIRHQRRCSLDVIALFLHDFPDIGKCLLHVAEIIEFRHVLLL